MASSSSLAAPSIAAPREALAPGHLLIELQPGIALTELRQPSPIAGTASALTVPSVAAELYRMGGVELELDRPIVEGELAGPEAQSGPIYLFRLFPPVDKDDDGSITSAALRRVADDARVRRAEGDHLRHSAAMPNDPLFADQWNLRAIRMPQAWELGAGSTDVVVAVLDTGIVLGHPDLAGRLVPGYDFITNPESADDGDNRRDADPTDTGSIESSRLHGTHVAGIIGAVTDNLIGIAGIDPRCRIMPVRVLGVRGGDGLDSDIADAVLWASGIPVGKLPPPEKPADVLNLSFGGPTVSFTLQRVIDQVLARGALVVVAAGNGGVDARTFSPGGLDSVISVGASSKSGSRADYSNHGPRVDLLAPGGDGTFDEDGNPEGVLSTYRDEGRFENPAVPLFSYYPLTGTSQAAPHVAAAASLSRALWPALRQSSLAALLSRSSSSSSRCDRDPLTGCGAGLLDVEALLLAVKEQVRCGCTGGKLCLDGKTCVDPPPLHDAHFQENTLRSSFCAVSAISNSRRADAPGAWLFLLVLAGWAELRRRVRTTLERAR